MAPRSSYKKNRPKPSPAHKPQLDHIHHVAIPVSHIANALEWYTSRFKCQVEYMDETWAMLTFANTKIALVLPQEHPPHVSITRPDANKFGELTTHRDGLHSVYITDMFGNSIEILETP